MEGKKPYLCCIGVTNFKAFGAYTELELEQLTLLAGLNSSGKSSIYQSLLLLSQSSDYYFRSSTSTFSIPMLSLNEKYIELGNTDDILFDKKNNKVTFRLVWSNNSSIELEYKAVYNSNTSKDSYNSKIMVLSKYQYIGVDSEILLNINRFGKWNIIAKRSLSFAKYNLFELINSHVKDIYEKNGKIFKIEIMDVFNDVVKFNDVDSFVFKENALYEFKVNFDEICQCIKPRYRKYVDIQVLKKICTKNNIDISLLSFMVSEFPEHKKSIINSSRMAYIPPFRGYPRRLYSSNTSPNPLTNYQYLKHKIIPYRHIQEDNSIIEGTVEEAIHYWIVVYFELANKIEFRELIPGVASEVFLVSGNNKIAINNVGFGTSQIVPIIYKILTSRRDLIIVDEPEIHLHASIQSKLATFFYEMMSLGKRLLIETHSEYLIDKVIYHNMLQQNDSKHAKLCWVIKSDRGSEIVNIKHDDLGYILNSPSGFLSEKAKLVNDINTIRMSKI